MSQIGKSTETESDCQGMREGGTGTINRYRVSFKGDGNVLELASGDYSTTQ